MAKNRRIRERHFVVDIFASAAGGALVAAILQKSWLMVVITVMMSLFVYQLDKIGIDNEENNEKD